MRTRILEPALTVLAIGWLLGAPQPAHAKLAPGELKQIAEEAFVYGLPLVMNYAVLHEYFIDTTSPEYKAPFNQLYNTARVYTPKDTAVVTPNSDTPYSFVGMDLRAEPYVICNPEIEPGRYFSVQLVDLYTSNYGYAGSRTTGNGAGCHLIAGPAWRGEKPAGIQQVFRSETDFSLAIVRTQLFEPADIENVKKIQAGYRGLPLSQFLGQPAPPPAPAIQWPKIDKQTAEADPFSYLNFVLQFCTATGSAAVEQPLRERFARIGIQPGQPFPHENLSAVQKAELKAGIQAGSEEIEQHVGSFGTLVNGWRITRSGFGDRKAMAGNWTMRAAAAKAGIYGNDVAEALYPMLAVDADGKKPDGSTGRYTLTFPAGQLPPANAFWSVTMYDGKTQLLVENPIDRYLINSPMLPKLAKDPDGSLPIYIQNDSPGKDKEANWLPAPAGPIFVVMRVYWPKPEALNGTWKPPAVQRVR
jgi:hypothetical protein